MPSSHLHMCVPIAEGNITNSQNFYLKQRSQTKNEEMKEKEEEEGKHCRCLLPACLTTIACQITGAPRACRADRHKINTRVLSLFSLPFSLVKKKKKKKGKAASREAPSIFLLLLLHRFLLLLLEE